MAKVSPPLHVHKRVFPDGGASGGGGGSEAANSNVVATTRFRPNSSFIGDNNPVVVTLRDASNVIMVGVNVLLHVSPVTPDDGLTGVTNGMGQYTFTVTSANPGTFVYSVTDTDHSVTVTQTASIVYSNPAGVATQLGWFT